jgi:FSR family fosmidomycin resistance protein-like MFS transporter
MLLFPAFLLVPVYPAKLLILALLGFFNAGWYAILQGQVYSALPGRSGTALTLTTIFGLVGSLMPLGIGLAAQWLGLETAIWLLMAGPIVLMVGLPRQTADYAALVPDEL